MRIVCCLGTLIVIVMASPLAQSPSVVSPEIHPDGRVTVRVFAPTASSVQVFGNWMGPQPPVALNKGANGIWEAVVGPLKPNLYSYAFMIDGVRTADPACRCTFVQAGRFAESRLTIPATPPRSWEAQNNPSGTLHRERFFSARQKRTGSFVVYTPPGYSASANPFPVLFLLPGTPGDETDWTSGGGFVEVMLDNLIAQKTMVPAVVVMHASDVLDPPDERRGDENLFAFESVIVNEVVPAVKQRYRVSSDSRQWAIAGLSLGGEFGMYVGLNHPNVFLSVASISGSLVPPSFDKRFGPALAKGATQGFRLVWIGSGTEDLFFGGAKGFAARLDAAKILHTFRQIPGAHTMPVARELLAELLVMLFR